MFDTKTVSLEWGGKTLTLETGRIARQADGAVLATYGETVVLCAVTAAKSVKEGQDFFPLTVHYQEKFSAAGRIPGGFFKRERGATEKETLTSRLSTVRSARCSRKGSTTRSTLSRRCCRMTARPRPTWSQWSPPRPR